MLIMMDTYVMNLILLLISFTTLTIVSVRSQTSPSLARSISKPGDKDTLDQIDYHYAIVLDCGSSGTRANIYRWNSKLKYPAILNEIELLKNPLNKQPITKKVSPGLSTMSDDKSRTEEYFKGIIDLINEKFPEENHKKTGLFILATAGMRLVEESLRDTIMQHTAEIFKEHFNFATVKTSVISGADEGMMTWTTANSRLRLFSSKDANQTVGIIEMGGASLQVTYRVTPQLKALIRERLAVSEAQTLFPDLLIRAMLGRNSEGYELVSVTFLGFGSNSAYDAYVDLLISKKLFPTDHDGTTTNWFKRISSFLSNDPQVSRRRVKNKLTLSASLSSSPSSSSLDKSVDSDDDDYDDEDEEGTFSQSRQLEIEDPCLPIGNPKAQTKQKPRSMLSARHKTIGFQLKDGEQNLFTVKIKGTSNYDKCLANMRELLMLMKTERMNCEDLEQEACSMSLIGTPFIPFNEGEFIGTGDLYFSTAHLDSSDGSFDQPRIRRKAREICEMTYQEIKQRWPDMDKYDPTRITMECFKGVWVYNLMTEGFLLNLDNDNFRTAEKIEGTKLEWTLGAALIKSLPVEMAIASRSPSSGGQIDMDMVDLNKME